MCLGKEIQNDSSGINLCLFAQNKETGYRLAEELTKSVFRDTVCCSVHNSGLRLGQPYLIPGAAVWNVAVWNVDCEHITSFHRGSDSLTLKSLGPPFCSVLGVITRLVLHLAPEDRHSRPFRS